MKVAKFYRCEYLGQETEATEMSLSVGLWSLWGFWVKGVSDSWKEMGREKCRSRSRDFFLLFLVGCILVSVTWVITDADKMLSEQLQCSGGAFVHPSICLSHPEKQLSTPGLSRAGCVRAHSSGELGEPTLRACGSWWMSTVFIAFSPAQIPWCLKKPLSSKSLP